MKTVTKCRYADRYKARRKPSCGCFVCETKWRIAEIERMNENLSAMLDEAIKTGRRALKSADSALYVSNLSR